MCVRVCVCDESTAQEQSLYDKLNIATDFLLGFRDFQLTLLSEVVSFTGYRPFCSFFELAAIFLYDELPRASYAHMQAGFCMECTICHVAFLEFVLILSRRIVVGFPYACISFKVEVVSC